MNRPLVCVTLRGRTADEMASDAAVAKAAGADAIEARLDHLWTIEHPVQANPRSDTRGNGDGAGIEVEVRQLDLDAVDLGPALSTIVEATNLPMVIACRPERQGGYYPGNEDQRIEVLRAAIACGPRWIDLESDIAKPIRDELVGLTGDSTGIIASMHSIEGTPSPSAIAQDIEDNHDLGDIIKACYPTRNRAESLRIFEAAWELRDSGINTALMGLGPGGDWARIHAPLLDQFMVYTTTESGWHLAQQGRINASDLQTAWSLLEYA
ncbi:MAG: type I 3-dehydroquinate dehydratase [Candidatus Thalassarchaeaceae archaeon]|nr:type I 3-dehydroquinate dehydratase [Candidatus Thalassarchaeaceae archaeon]